LTLKALKRKFEDRKEGKDPIGIRTANNDVFTNLETTESRQEPSGTLQASNQASLRKKTRATKKKRVGKV
jgi:hypothetical protein